MILGIITFIFSTIGIYGFYTNNFIFLYFGLSFVIIQHIIGIVTGKEKSLSIVWIAIIVAVGLTISGMNFLTAIAICLCFENTILFIPALILMLISFFKVSKNNEDD